MNPDPFHVLGLSADADAAAVKKAFARQVKAHRPDDDPAAFQRVMDAYHAALDACAARALPKKSGAGGDSWRRREPILSSPAGPDFPVRKEPTPLPPPRPAAKARPAEELHWALQNTDWNWKAIEGPTIDEPFDAPAFLTDLHRIGLQTPREVGRWLSSEPALCSLQLKDRLEPALVWFLENAEPLPLPALNAILGFFGLDGLGSRTATHRPALDRLLMRSRASFEFTPESEEAAAAAGPGNAFRHWPLTLFFLLVFLSRCAMG